MKKFDEGLNIIILFFSPSIFKRVERMDGTDVSPSCIICSQIYRPKTQGPFCLQRRLNFLLPSLPIAITNRQSRFKVEQHRRRI